jgi:hypothetical protein
VKEFMRQHRVAAREPVPVRSIDAGKIVEHACAKFGQLKSPTRQKRGSAEQSLRMRRRAYPA